MEEVALQLGHKGQVKYSYMDMVESMAGSKWLQQMPLRWVGRDQVP